MVSEDLYRLCGNVKVCPRFFLSQHFFFTLFENRAEKQNTLKFDLKKLL